MIQAKVGQYFYARHRSNYGVWCYNFVSEDGKSAFGTFIKDFPNREEAREYVWLKNGWGAPKTTLKN